MLVKKVKIINKKAVKLIFQVPKGWKSGKSHSVKLPLLPVIKLVRRSYRKDVHPDTIAHHII